ncbi:MAG: hypothetical protein PHP44_15365, partial [Kiritimatiellae bacterium]|nr:hypothetical protein [Kiritimatiellia bacterium]
MTPGERYALWKEQGGLRFLRRVNVEISAVCNLRCAYCSLHPRRGGPAFMPEALFQRVLNELTKTPV